MKIFTLIFTIAITLLVSSCGTSMNFKNNDGFGYQAPQNDIVNTQYTAQHMS